MLVQDEETVELRETFTSLQQEVEAKTKKLKKVGSLQRPQNRPYMYMKFEAESCGDKQYGDKRKKYVKMEKVDVLFQAEPYSLLFFCF